jgi:hypothetical protein
MQRVLYQICSLLPPESKKLEKWNKGEANRLEVLEFCSRTPGLSDFGRDDPGSSFFHLLSSMKRFTIGSCDHKDNEDHESSINFTTMVPISPT